ncbi:type II secretion system protein, partial [Pseudomonas syringae pv. pisi str. 1704B]
MELLFAAMMLAAAAFLLLSGIARQRSNERLVARRLRGQVIRESRIGSLLRVLGAN